MTTHYFAWLVGGISLMCASVAAQPAKVTEPTKTTQAPKVTQSPELKFADPLLPTVDITFDFSKFNAPPATGVSTPVFELPSNLPSVPESLGFPPAKLTAKLVPVNPPANKLATPKQDVARNPLALKPVVLDPVVPLPPATNAPNDDRVAIPHPALPIDGGQVPDTKIAVNSSHENSFPPIPILEGQQVAIVDMQSPLPSSSSIATTLTQPWWTEPESLVADHAGAMNVELDRLIWMAMERSPYVRSLLIEPQIMEARASATLGVFDPAPFINSVFNDTSNPVGNTLTTGGPSRLNDNLWENSAGIKAKTQGGAQTELAQEMNLKDSNSVFFLPGQQADSKMVLRFTQPLMRGAGKTYNRSSYVVANLSTSESMLDVSTKMQQHAFTISTNYWELFYARANFQQSERGLRRLIALRDQLAGRADLDSLRSQLHRADAQISRQRSQQARSQSQVTASEAKLRAAVGASELASEAGRDLIPITLPADWKPNLDIQSELGLALNCHPNILATHARIKAAKVRLQVAENELRPTLNLVMEGYARGLNGDYNIGSSFGDQFSQGSPSYSAGMSYQRPYRNVAAKAILREKRLEMQKLLFDLDNALLLVSAEVESEIASAEAAYAELEAAVRGTLAAHAELEYLEARWGNAFLEPTQSGTSLLLDQLLNANVQLIQAENAWARAQADHMLALSRVRLASGTLLSVTAP